MSKTVAKTPPSFSLRPPAPPDDGFLLRLYAETRAEELARTGWDAARRDAFLRQQFLARRADYRARFVGAEESIIVIEGEDAGVWMVWRGPEETRLVNVEIRSDLRRRGVGGALIRGLLEEAFRHSRPVTLSVREENRAAKRLYSRMGFISRHAAGGYLQMEAPAKTRA